MEDIRSSIIQQVIGALFDYLGKPLGGITTYDIRFYLSSRRQPYRRTLATNLLNRGMNI